MVSKDHLNTEYFRVCNARLYYKYLVSTAYKIILKISTPFQKYETRLHNYLDHIYHNLKFVSHG